VKFSALNDRDKFFFTFIMKSRVIFDIYEVGERVS